MLKKINKGKAKKLFNKGKRLIINNKGEKHFMYPQYLAKGLGYEFDDFDKIIEYHEGKWNMDFNFYMEK